MDEEKLAKQLEEYHKLAQQDKNIDVASLMIQALQKQETNHVPDRQKRWGYLVSLAFPPFGLIFAIKFYLSDADDGKTVALMCVVLTAVSLFLFVLISKLMFSGSGVDINQIQQIKPEDIQSLY